MEDRNIFVHLLAPRLDEIDLVVDGVESLHLLFEVVCDLFYQPFSVVLIAALGQSLEVVEGGAAVFKYPAEILLPVLKLKHLDRDEHLSDDGQMDLELAVRTLLGEQGGHRAAHFRIKIDELLHLKVGATGLAVDGLVVLQILEEPCDLDLCNGLAEQRLDSQGEHEGIEQADVAGGEVMTAVVKVALRKPFFELLDNPAAIAQKV